MYHEDVASSCEFGENWQKEMGLSSPTWLAELIKFWRGKKQLTCRYDGG